MELKDKKKELEKIKTEFVNANKHLINAAMMFNELDANGFDSTIDDIKQTIGELQVVIEIINQQNLAE